MRYYTYIFFLFLLTKGIYADDYPWSSISHVSFTINMHQDGINDLNEFCRCYCDSNSGIESQFRSFTIISWDADSCFWKILLSNSNPSYKKLDHIHPKFKKNGYRVIKIEVYNKQGKILESEIVNSVSDTFIMNIQNDFNGYWTFKLTNQAISDLNNKIDQAIQSGFSDLKSYYDKNIKIVNHSSQK